MLRNGVFRPSDDSLTKLTQGILSVKFLNDPMWLSDLAPVLAAKTKRNLILFKLKRRNSRLILDLHRQRLLSVVAVPKHVSVKIDYLVRTLVGFLD